ncbi:MAG: DUF4112 domain-containing protein [Bacteroidales bacterium]|nr:DUF4112 domain-containing protein [Bacteroidales bacterium]
MTTELRKKMETSSTYQLTRKIARYMDDYYLDPIAGFALPAGVGDFITQLFSIPYLYISIAKIKSTPLTLAIICNILLDFMVGLIPFFIGDLADIFLKSYKKNLILIEGFIDNDEKIVKEVNGKALIMGIAIFVLLFLIGALIYLLVWIIGAIGSLFS